jgi:hypothetical protein
MAQLGLLTKATLLAEFKARGVLVTVEDVAEEVEAMAVEAEQAVERQMAAMADRMISDRQPPQDPNDPPADQAEDAAQ